MEKKIIIPEINKELEKFDIEKFKLHQKYRVEEIGEEYLTVYTGNPEKTNLQTGFSTVVFPFNSVFCTIKNYHSNGNIQIKGVRFNNGSEYGIWYEFDENGKLIKETDMDEGYDFGWHDIINYCHHNNIVLEKGYPEKGGIKTEIYKREEAGSKLWIISYYDFQAQQYLEVTLDGKTGKEISRRKLEWTGN